MSFLADTNWKTMLTRLSDSGVEVWRTKDEIGFLVNLGTHATFMTQRTVPDRKTLLRRYIKAARQRKVWDEIDREACLEMAATLLVDEEKT